MKNMKVLLVAIIMAIGMLNVAGAAIYEDDFSTDPFASRWTQTFPGGAYPSSWSTGYTPPSGSLPTPDENTIYTFSEGLNYIWTTYTATESLSHYIISVDFKMLNSITDLTISTYAQRQSDNSNYATSVFLGGSGEFAWAGVYGFQWSAVNLSADTWYTMTTEVWVGDTDVQIQSNVYSGDTLLATSAVFTDSSESRYTTVNGYGMSVNRAFGYYWSRAQELDNFIVTIPEPVTTCLLGLGGLGLFVFKRRQ